MAETFVYLTAGLPVTKDSSQPPDGGSTTVFLTAGLPKVVKAAPSGNPWYYYMQQEAAV